VVYASVGLLLGSWWAVLISPLIVGIGTVFGQLHTHQ
jgi:hypothetical protein